MGNEKMTKRMRKRQRAAEAKMNDCATRRSHCYQGFSDLFSVETKSERRKTLKEYAEERSKVKAIL